MGGLGGGAEVVGLQSQALGLCWLRKIQWVHQTAAAFRPQLAGNIENVLILIAAGEGENRHSSGFIWKYQWFKWQISNWVMPAGRWGLSLSLCVTYQPQEQLLFIYFSLFFSLADSVKCLHEVDALCQIGHQLAHLKGIHL